MHTTSSQGPGAGCGLLGEVARWMRAEESDRELGRRVSAALGELRSFLAERRADLERRKGRLLQTGAFREETRGMEEALAEIEGLLAGGRNVSRIFAEIDRYLRRYGVADTLSRSHTRAELTEARDAFMCAFQDSIRGTRLGALLEILYFMPYAFWISRGIERRNYRSPSAAEISALLEEFRHRGVDCDPLDTVQLAALIRSQLGITPRMDYQSIAGNRLAEQLTSGENLTGFTSKVMPPDEMLCRTTGRMLGDLRRWSSELLAEAGLAVPAEIEAEMLQIALLAGESVPLSGSGGVRSVDYLWLLSTAIASGHAALKEALAWPAVRESRFASVHERFRAAKTSLDRIAAVVDGILAARWAEAREELAALVGRSEAIGAKPAHEFGDVKELERLKEGRSEIGKALIKISESLQLLEPTLLDLLSAGGEPTGLPAVDARLRALYPGAVIDRNRACAEETGRIARQELERLRALIERIAAISRKGFAAGAPREAAERPHAAERPVRRISDGTEIGATPPVELEAMLLGALRGALEYLRDTRVRIEGARKRVARNDLLHALNVLGEKCRRAVELGGRALEEAPGAPPAREAAEQVAALLRECLMAQTSFSGRVGSARLSPAERSPLAPLLHPMKARLSDDLRDVEGISAELAERAAPAAAGAAGTAGEERPAGRVARLAGAANRALGPVKEMVTMLEGELSGGRRDTLTILGATRRLQDAVAEARDLIAEKRALADEMPAASAVDGGEHAGKFDRWQRQLETIDAECERLLLATECLAGIEESVRIASGLGDGMPGGPDAGTGGDTAGGEPLPEKERALEAIERTLAWLPVAREVCAAAARERWRVLKGGAGYLAGCDSAFDGHKTSLEGLLSRIDARTPSG